MRKHSLRFWRNKIRIVRSGKRLFFSRRNRRCRAWLSIPSIERSSCLMKWCGSMARCGGPRVTNKLSSSVNWESRKMLSSYMTKC